MVTGGGQQRASAEAETAHWRFVFEHGREGLVRVRPDGTVAEGNAQAARLLGRALNALPGLELALLFSPTSARRLTDALAAGAERGAAPQLVLDVQLPDGAVRVVEARLALHPGTDALLLLDAGLEPEDRVSAHLEPTVPASSSGLSILRAVAEGEDRCESFTFAHVDAGTAALLGLPPQLLVHRAPEEVLPLSASQRFTAHLSAVCRGEQPPPVELALRRGLTLRMTASRLGSGIAVSLADVSAQARDAWALQLSARVGDALTRVEGPAEAVQALATLLIPEAVDGLCLQHAAGEPGATVVSVHHQPELMEAFSELCARLSARAQASGGAGLSLAEPEDDDQGEHIRALRRGPLLRLEVRARGRAVGMLWFTRGDGGPAFQPGELRLLESVANQLGPLLELGRETKALRQELTQARAELAQQVREKDAMLARISHELRTPLMAIVTWARVISGDKVPAARRARGLRAIELAAKTQAQVVDDLVDLSGLTRDAVRLARVPVSLATAAREAVEQLRPEIAEKGVDVQLEAPEGAGWVRGDPERLRQVLWNLLGNAVKFTPASGRVRLEVSADADAVVVKVSDTGAGIPAALIPHVFERFWQRADAGAGEGGLGLGLSLSRELVQRQGGTIAVASAGEGRGTTFTVRLPALGAAGPLRLRVLVVGPVPEPLALGLEQAGCTVSRAESWPASALQWTRARPAVVLVAAGVLRKLSDLKALARDATHARVYVVGESALVPPGASCLPATVDADLLVRTLAAAMETQGEVRDAPDGAPGDPPEPE